MAINNVTGVGTSFNLPNFAGDLFKASPTNTPFLTMIGGLSGGKKTDSDEFATNQLYEFPAAAQPGVSESASVTAPTPTALARVQETNVTQIFHEAISLTYAKQANRGKLSGLNIAGQQGNPQDELGFQVEQRLIKIARDVEYTFLNGKYAKATSASEANQTRGMIELCSTGTTIAAADAALDSAMLKKLFLAMANAGANFNRMVMFAGAYQKQAITSIYEKQLGYTRGVETSIAGMNVTEIETDFCKCGITYDPFMPADTILVADVSAIAPVFQEVPGKGTLFVEELAKTGAASSYQIYGEIGLAHGPSFLHGTITGLKSA